MKYYFITYQAINKSSGKTSCWNQVIDISPMEFIKDATEDSRYDESYYNNFVVINTLEISKEEFYEFKGRL